MSATDVFVAHRNLLFTVAYEMLGSAADAEDVLQETWLRWARGRPVGGARRPGLPGPDHHPAGAEQDAHRWPGAASRTSARGCRSRCSPAPDVAEDVELADSVSMAMLLVLETLNPTERAVFVLREVFDVRVRRDRRRRRQDTGRGAPDRAPGPHATSTSGGPTRTSRRAQRDEVIARFLEATVDRRRAEPPRRAVAGRRAGHRRRRREAGGAAPDPRPRQGDPLPGRRHGRRASQADLVVVNGAPAVRVVLDGELDTVGTLLVEDGLVTGLYWVRNPAEAGPAGRGGRADAVTS